MFCKQDSTWAKGVTSSSDLTLQMKEEIPRWLKYTKKETYRRMQNRCKKFEKPQNRE